jgi:hypothetical protein
MPAERAAASLPVRKLLPISPHQPRASRACSAIFASPGMPTAFRTTRFYFHMNEGKKQAAPAERFNRFQLFFVAIQQPPCAMHALLRASPILVDVPDDFHVRNGDQAFANHLLQVRHELLNLFFGINYAHHDRRVGGKR